MCIRDRLSGEQFLLIRRLAENTNGLFRWFTNEVRDAYPALSLVLKDSYYEKNIKLIIDEVLDEAAAVKDSASEALAEIRLRLYRRRNELRRLFDRIVSKLNKQGYLTDIEESFMNGRRVLAVFAEQKRTVKGVLHGESDSRRTSFIAVSYTHLDVYKRQVYAGDVGYIITGIKVAKDCLLYTSRS